MEHDPANEEVPPPTSIDVPSSSTAPLATTAIATSKPIIIDAIAALFAHMDVIHKDLVDRIGQFHERVDLIVERQKHDIKAIHDTLSALSRWHTEFITEVNDFINSIRRRWSNLFFFFDRWPSLVSFIWFLCWFVLWILGCIYGDSSLFYLFGPFIYIIGCWWLWILLS